MRPWDYEAAQTEEPIQAPNTTVRTSERLYLSPEELNGRYNSIPQNMIMPDLNQLKFLAAQPESDATSPQERLAEELAGLCGVFNATEADLQATAPDQETTLREGPFANLPASPHWLAQSDRNCHISCCPGSRGSSDRESERGSN